VTVSSSTVTCVVVDDDPSVREVVSRVLEAAGYRIFQVNSGPAALDLLEREHENVELVISDLQMPGMDGAELLRQVSTRWPDLGIVIIT
jgi:CheY-like chemotaxis protein